MNNINQKLEKALSSMNKRDLQTLMHAAKSSGILSKLSENDKKKIMTEFAKLDTEEISRKLSKLNTNDLSRLNTNDLIKVLKGL